MPTGTGPLVPGAVPADVHFHGPLHDLHRLLLIDQGVLVRPHLHQLNMIMRITAAPDTTCHTLSFPGCFPVFFIDLAVSIPEFHAIRKYKCSIYVI